jgi:cytoskeletal protein CcmA (bactofilin family)
MSESNKRRIHDRAGGPATLISEGCKVAGVISGDGDFLVSGEVEGECDLSGSLTIAPNGLWKGSISASAVVVAGTVEGDIVSAGRVEISDTARITGTVTGQAIAVAEGAVVQGNMKTTGNAEPVGFVEKRKSSKPKAEETAEVADSS